jgi:hypothetical protein
MTTFDERERAFECKFAREEEVRFRALVRRNRALGHWVAERLGRPTHEAVSYASTLVNSDLHQPGDETIFRNVRAEFDAAGMRISDGAIRAQMATLRDRAVTEIQAGL